MSEWRKLERRTAANFLKASDTPVCDYVPHPKKKGFCLRAPYWRFTRIKFIEFRVRLYFISICFIDRLNNVPRLALLLLFHWRAWTHAHGVSGDHVGASTPLPCAAAAGPGPGPQAARCPRKTKPKNEIALPQHLIFMVKNDTIYSCTALPIFNILDC